MSTHQKRSAADHINLDDHMRLNRQSIDAAIDFYKTFAGTMTGLNSEAVRFMNKRLKEDVKLPDELMECHTPADAATAQFRFFGKMLADYTEESQKIAGLMWNAFPKGEAQSTPKHGGRY